MAAMPRLEYAFQFMTPIGFKFVRTLLRTVLALSLAGIFSGRAGAASATWTGAGGNDYWTNNANWNTGAYPGSQAGNSSTTDTATFTNNSPAQTTINLGSIDVYIENITIAAGSPAFTFVSTAPAYLLFPDIASAGNITVASGVTTTQDFSGLALIRGQSGAGSTAYNIANNSASCFMKMPVLTQYSTSGNIRVVFSGTSGAQISATGSNRGAQATELLLNAPVIVYLLDSASDGNFTGGLYIRQGTVSVASVALKIVGHSPLGSTNFIYLGSDDNTGQTSTLQFTGTGSGTTDEPFSLTKGNTGVFDITNAAGNLILTTTLNEINSSSTTLSGNLIKTDVGTLTLDAKSSYTGTTTINGGTLSLGTANAISTSSGLTLGGSGTAGTLDLGGFSQQLSVLATASGAVAASQIITNSSTANLATLVFSNLAANPSVFGGAIVDGSKPVALTVLSGSLTLTNAGTYSGNTTITAGRLVLGAGGSIASSGTIFVNTNAIFDVSGNGSFNLNPGQTLSGYGVVTGSVTAASCLISPGVNGVAGTLTFTNSLTLNGGVTNEFDLATTPGTGNDLMVVGGVLNLSGTNTIQVNLLGSTLSAGTYPLIQFGLPGGGGATNFQVTGTLGVGLQAVVSVTATAVDLVVSEVGGTQRTWVGDGSINAWDYTTMNWLDGATPAVFSDGNFVTFDDTGSSTPPVNLTTTLQPAAVTVAAAANYTFSGVGQISGAATLTKTNSGSLTILTTNNYYGITTIGQGILQLGNGTTSGALGTNLIQNSGALVLNLPGGNSFANVISGPGQFVQAGSGTLTLTASNSYSGGTTISNGTLQLNTGAWFGGGNVTNNGQLTFNGSGNSTAGAVISGTGALTLAGSGTVSLAGNNTYSGGTSVSKGSLLVNNSSGSGTGPGPVTVAGGATLGGGGEIGGPVTINSGGILAPGNPVGTLTVGNNFTAASGAILNYTLGASSDKTVVSSNLNLSGTLNITAGTGFTSTTYTLFTYGGTLTLGSLAVNLPANTTGTLNTNTPGQVNLVVGTLQLNIPAFPGALGFGATAYGGRIGGTVYHVTNTNDSGAGSFRTAVSQANTFVVFDVGGTITLASAVTCSSSLTIAGQTAPGGIAIIGHEVSMSLKTNEIVRFLRIRPGSITGGDDEDGIDMGDGTNMIFDHVSIEFAPYNNIDATGSDSDGSQITFQNSILADPIGQQFNAHTEAVGHDFSWFYNIFSSGHDRNPLAKVNTIFINNIVNNFQAGYTVADTSGNFSHDIINNYFIAGPATTSDGDDFFQFDSNQSVYSSGNLENTALNGTLSGGSTAPGGDTVLNSPWSPVTATIPTFPTFTAYRNDVSMAGALPLDQVDQNVMGDVTSLGTAGMGGGLWTTQTATGLGNDGYGVITPGVLPVDTDGDGMPDYWEVALGSNPNVADSLTPGTGGYTKLENYLNWLANPHAITQTNASVTADLTQYTGGFTNASPVYSVFAPTNGTVTLLAGGHTAQFTPAANFSGLGSFNFSVLASDGSAMTNTVTVCVTPLNKSTPRLQTAPTASAITYGQTLGAATLSNGAATNAAGTAVPGTFTFTTINTVPGAGTAGQSVTFTPTDTVDYNSYAFNVSVTVNQATPLLQTAPTASAITYGQALGAATLSNGAATNAAGTAVPGTFTFTTTNTVPGAGTAGQPVNFTPTDATDYDSVAAITTINVTVNPKALNITANNTNKVYGQTVTFAGTEFTSSGLTNGDSVTRVTLTSGGVTNTAAAGSYPITPSAAAGGGLGNYNISYVNGTLTVIQASPSVGVTSSENPSGFKDSVSFTANLSSTNATGVVQFLTNGVWFDTEMLSNGSAGSLATALLPRGTNTITAGYAGDGNNLGGTNTLSGGQVVTNHPPVAAVMTVTRTAGLALTIALTDVATNWSDVDGDTVTLAGINLVTTNNVDLTTNSAGIFYPNGPNVNDQFSYSISDGQGGTNVGLVNVAVVVMDVTGQATGSVLVSGGLATVGFAGLPGYTYNVQRSTNLTEWVTIWTTNAPDGGMFQYTDAFGDLDVAPPSAYYRLTWSALSQ
jgi:autotransporter-associated beta strand protein